MNEEIYDSEFRRAEREALDPERSRPKSFKLEPIKTAREERLEAVIKKAILDIGAIRARAVGIETELNRIRTELYVGTGRLVDEGGGGE